MSEKKLGMAIGRPCCGSRTMCLSEGDESRKSKFVEFREFEGWYCSVNWFFMHIEQHSDSVFHHQTCQANFGQTRGPWLKIFNLYPSIGTDTVTPSYTNPFDMCDSESGICFCQHAYQLDANGYGCQPAIR